MTDEEKQHKLKKQCEAYNRRKDRDATQYQKICEKERQKYANMQPEQKKARIEQAITNRELRSSKTTKGSIAMENPPYMETDMSVEVSTSSLNVKHTKHVTPGERQTLLARQNKKFMKKQKRAIYSSSEEHVSMSEEDNDIEMQKQPEMMNLGNDRVIFVQDTNEDDYMFSCQEWDRDVDIEIREDEETSTKISDPYDIVYNNIPDNTNMLKNKENCIYCNAKKFYRSDPKHLELYFYDDDPSLEHRYRRCREEKYEQDKHVVTILTQILRENPYSKQFITLGQNEKLDDYKLILNLDQRLDQRTYNAPITSEVAAVWIEGNERRNTFGKNIILHGNNNEIQGIKSYYGCYDPLSYPLFFPRAELGWHSNIPRANTILEELRKDNHSNSYTDSSSKLWVTMREYYCYRFHARPSIFNPILHGGRLFQQFAVDTYIKIESSRLDFIWYHQKEIKADLYKGLLDSIQEGEQKGDKVGKRTVLASSFIGGPRDKLRRYLDAMALVRKYGKPDIFLTMTCNPNWEEITRELQFAQTPQDRPDLVVRVFRAKLEEMKNQLFKKHILGKVKVYTYVVEFQKRGLPHAHFLLIMTGKYKYTCQEQYDRIISAELPDKHKYPDLYKMVIKHMMHGACGILNKNCPCTKNRASCKNNYPRPFNETTIQGKDSYPLYRRRNDGRNETVQNCKLDNRWVVPYNPYLLRFFNCHINVEVCSSIKAVKYLFKYIYKGHDRASVSVTGADDEGEIDEIRQLQNARWVTPPEALWRIYGFELSKINPSVMQLQLHLPNMHMPRKVLAIEETESYIPGWQSSDNTIDDCMTEAELFHMPSSLRRLFATILVFCEPSNINTIWNNHLEAMSEDYSRNCKSKHMVQQMVLKNIRDMLQSMGKDIRSFPLPEIDEQQNTTNDVPREIIEESTIEVDQEDASLHTYLNKEQKAAYEKILAAVNIDSGGLFFVYGPGGTGKTFLYRALLATVRGQGKIALATATSGVATSIMPGGRTAHSRFKIPLRIDDGSILVFGGDFRQVLPIVRKGTRAQIVDASLRRSGLWNCMQQLELVHNMRAQKDPWFAEYLLRIGNGTEETNENGEICLPTNICVQHTTNGNGLDTLIDNIYQMDNALLKDPTYITSRAILSTRNDCVDNINLKMIERFQGDEMVYYSFDSVEDDPHNYYPIEFLDTLTPNGVPPHMLKLKINCPIILLRNIDPANGLCNGTRLVVRGFQKNSIDTEIKKKKISTTETYTKNIVYTEVLTK
uniref:ATP-dependent DNA helicase n=1 Tax=Setaria italica TaxID=4555 RepID=K3Z0E3_SETIT